MHKKKPEISAPQIKLHKASGRAYVCVGNERRVYFGKYGSAKAEQRYRRFIAEWSAGGYDASPTRQLSVANLIDRYLTHCRAYYQQTDGTVLQEVQSIGYALAPVRDLYAKLPADQFGPLKLKAVRETMISRDWNRTYVNQQVGRIKRMFKWASENELVPPPVWQGLMSVDGLRAGRCRVREPRKVKPVPLELVEATKKHLPRQVVALIDLLLLTGARPSELLTLRPSDIDRGEQVWTYRPERHKNSHRGQERVIYFGKKSQAVLKEYLLRPADAFMFSPREAEGERYAKCEVHRRMNQKRNANASGRKVGDHYTATALYRAIQRACHKAFPPPKNLTDEEREAWGRDHRWHPYQLRHDAATLLAKEYGVEAAQTILGHKKLDVTQIYAERDAAKVKDIISKVG